MNTIEKTSTGVTPAELILSHSIRLSSHILTPVHNGVSSSDISLSDRLDEWISRQHTLQVNPLDVAQQNEQEFVVDGILAHHGNHHRRSPFGVPGSIGWLLRKIECMWTSFMMRALIPREHK